jgi:hypothetical protein
MNPVGDQIGEGYTSMYNSRLELARGFSNEQLEADPHLIVAFVIGSAARGDGVERSDIDVRFIVDPEAQTGTAHTFREGYFFDVESVHPSAFGNPEELLADPYLAGAIREAVILFDRDGALTSVQRQVTEQFAEPRWFRTRLSNLVTKIQANCEEIGAAIQADDPVVLFRQGAWALWNLSDALLVGEGRSPSWVRGLQKVGQALPDERDRIVEIEGSGSMGSDDVADLLHFFTEPGGDSDVISHVGREIEWMVGNGLHREALHALWAKLALMLACQIEADEQGTRALCRDWLEHIGWTGEALPEKMKQLEECAARLRQHLDDIG